MFVFYRLYFLKKKIAKFKFFSPKNIDFFHLIKKGKMDLQGEPSLAKQKSCPKKMQEVSRKDMQKFLNFSYKEHIFEEYYHRPYQNYKFCLYFIFFLETFF